MSCQPRPQAGPGVSREKLQQDPERNNMRFKVSNFQMGSAGDEPCRSRAAAWHLRKRAETAALQMLCTSVLTATYATCTATGKVTRPCCSQGRAPLTGPGVCPPAGTFCAWS